MRTAATGAAGFGWCRPCITACLRNKRFNVTVVAGATGYCCNAFFSSESRFAVAEISCGGPLWMGRFAWTEGVKMSMNPFEDKVVIVTGGGSGIGAATARRFHAEGAAVVLTGRTKEKLAVTARDMAAARHLLHVSDVSVPADVERLVADTVARFGRLDVLVNNAGIGSRGCPAATRTCSPATIRTVSRKAMAPTSSASSKPSGTTIPITSSAPPFPCRSGRGRSGRAGVFTRHRNPDPGPG